MTKNLTREQAIAQGKVAYYYFMYDATQDYNCKQCAFKMGYDPSGDVFCYGQCLESFEQEYKAYFRKQPKLTKEEKVNPSPFFMIQGFILVN